MESVMVGSVECIPPDEWITDPQTVGEIGWLMKSKGLTIEAALQMTTAEGNCAACPSEMDLVHELNRKIFSGFSQEEMTLGQQAARKFFSI